MRIHHKEALYDRTMSLQQSNDPKIRHKVAQNGVIKIIKVCKATHGFDGSIGLFAGHPDLLKDQVAQEQAVRKAFVKTFEQCVQEQINAGRTDMKQVLLEWRQESGEESVVAAQSATPALPVQAATVSVTDSNSSVSSVSMFSEGATPSKVATPTKSREQGSAPLVREESPRQEEPQQRTEQIEPQPENIETGSQPAKKTGKAPAKKTGEATAGRKRKAVTKRTAAPKRSKRAGAKAAGKKNQGDQPAMPSTPPRRGGTASQSKAAALAEETKKRWNCHEIHTIQLLEPRWQRDFQESTLHNKHEPQVCSHCQRKLVWGPNMDRPAETHCPYDKIKKGLDPTLMCCKNIKRGLPCKFVLCPSCNDELLREDKEWRTKHGQHTPRRKKNKPVRLQY